MIVGFADSLRRSFLRVLVDQLLGRVTARETAHYMEYNWQPAKKK